MEETWKPIPSTEGYYASEDGRIRGPRRILKPQKHPLGYRTVKVVLTGGRNICRTVHSLIAETFIGPRPKGLDIAHFDGDKTNNAAANLRYCTRKENLQDSHRHGVRMGPKQYANKAERIEVANLIAAGDLTIQEAANALGVPFKTVRNWAAEVGFKIDLRGTTMTTPEERETLTRAINAGLLSVREVAETLEISVATIYVWMREHGYGGQPRRSSPVLDNRNKEVVRRVRAGERQASVARLRTH